MRVRSRERCHPSRGVTPQDRSRCVFKMSIYARSGRPGQEEGLAIEVTYGHPGGDEDGQHQVDGAHREELSHAALQRDDRRVGALAGGAVHRVGAGIGGRAGTLHYAKRNDPGVELPGVLRAAVRRDRGGASVCPEMFPYSATTESRSRAMNLDPAVGRD